MINQEDDSLVLLDSVSEMLSDFDLSGVYLVAAQHILGTTLSMLKRLFVKGLDPKKVYLIGKCYSTSDEALKSMLSLGIKVAPESRVFHPHLGFDDYYPTLISKFVDQFLEQVDLPFSTKIILLDDGGFLITEFINRELHKKFLLSGVEQTTSGYNKIKSLTLPFPIVNVARSTVKLNYESPVIARVAFNILVEKLRILGLSPKNALILGGGAIGNAMHDELIATMVVDKFDIRKDQSDLPVDSLLEKISRYDLIVGCSGATSLPKHMHSFLRKDCILASVSSSDREFDAKYLRPPEHNKSQSASCHADLHYNDTFLLNSGFPINFYGGLHSVPPKYIQLTRSLLMLGIAQASDFQQNKGIKELSKQPELIEKYLKMFDPALLSV